MQKRIEIKHLMTFARKVLGRPKSPKPVKPKKAFKEPNFRQALLCKVRSAIFELRVFNTDLVFVTPSCGPTTK